MSIPNGDFLLILPGKKQYSQFSASKEVMAQNAYGDTVSAAGLRLKSRPLQFTVPDFPIIYKVLPLDSSGLIPFIVTSSKPGT